MFVSEDGTVTGSIDVSKLDEIEPKSDEAKAQLAALKAERDAGQAQAAADAERVAQLHEAQAAQLTGEPTNSGQQAEEVTRLQAEAEAAGVTVDKRWGADRLRSEIEKANAAKAKSGKQG
jgi:hypothetical protein